MAGKIGFITLESARKTGDRIGRFLSEWRDGEPVEIPADDAMAGSDVVTAVKLYTDFLGPMTVTQYGIEPPITGFGLFIDLVRILRGV